MIEKYFKVDGEIQEIVVRTGINYILHSELHTPLKFCKLTVSKKFDDYSRDISHWKEGLCQKF